jgi:ferrous iron transport protein B
VKAFVIAYVALGAAQITAGLVLNRMLKDDGKTDFIQELPRMRLPSLKPVLIKVYYRLWWFLKEAVPVFMATAVIMFVSDKIGLLGAIKHVLNPVLQGFLGLPIQMVDVLIVCIARREAAAGMMMHLVQHGDMNAIQ